MENDLLEIVKHISSVFADNIDVPVERLDVQCKLSEMDLSSLALISVFMSIEDKYRISMSDMEVDEYSIQDISERIYATMA